MDQGTPKWVVWLPVATASLSGVFAFVGVVVGQAMTMGREQELQHRQFQVETIIELQDTLDTVYNDIVSHGMRGYVTDDKKQVDHVAQSLLRIGTLATRVDDDSSRLAAEEFWKIGNNLMPRYIDPSQEDPEREIEAATQKKEWYPEFGDAYSRAIVLLGRTLRGLPNPRDI